MKFKKSFFISMILLVFILLSAVSAEGNDTFDDSMLEIAQSEIVGETPIQDVGTLGESRQLVENEDYEVFIPQESSVDGIDIVGVKKMPMDSRGNISISVDDIERYNQKVSVGGNALFLGDLNLNYGSHNVSISYTGDSNYAGFMKNGLFEKTYLHVNCDAYVPFNGSAWAECLVELDKGVTGNINILFDGYEGFNGKYSTDYPPNVSRDGLYSTYEVRYSNGNQMNIIRKGLFNVHNGCDYDSFNIFYSDQIDFGDNVTFAIDIPNGISCSARFKNNTYSVARDENEYYAYLELSCFDMDENIVEFTFYSNNTYLTQNCSLSVLPKIILPNNLIVNESYELIFQASEECNGDLILSGMVNGTFKVNNGSAIVPISSQNVGYNRLNIVYEDYVWDKYIDAREKLEELDIVIFSIGKIYPWSWADSDGDSGPGIDVYMSSNKKELPTGNTTIYLNDKVIGVFSGEFSYLIDESRLWEEYTGKGVYTVKVVFSGDDNFKPVNETYNFALAGYICEIEDNVVRVELPSYVSGVLTVKANGETYTKQINATYHMHMSYSSESYKLPLEGLEEGVDYSVEVNFQGNSNISSFTEYLNLNYQKKCPIGIYLKEYNGYYFSHEIGGSYYICGEDNLIIVTAPKDLKNKLNVLIDGKSYEYSQISKEIRFYVDDDTVAYKVNVSNLSPGKHNICISYPGDSKYPSHSSNATIPIMAKIRYIDEDMPIISLRLPDDAIGKLSVEIVFDWNSDYNLFESVGINNGEATIQLPCGDYYLRAYYTGNDYKIVERQGWEHVSPRPMVMNYGQTQQFRVPNCANATLVLYIGSNVESRLPITEIAYANQSTISVNKEVLDEALKTGMAKLIVEQNYNEYESYFLQLTPIVYTIIGNYELHPIIVNLTAKITGAKDINMYYSDSKTITLNVYDIYGKLAGKNQDVLIKIGKKIFSANTDKNGIAKLKIPNTITPGKYTVTISYKNAKITKKLTVKQVLTLKAVKVKKSSKKLVLTATLKKGKKAIKNTKVTFKFNGKTYKAKTNKKGIAKVTIKKAVLKKLKVGRTVKYQATYLKDTVKKSAKVYK